MGRQKIRLIATITVLLVCGFLATSFISYFVAERSVSQQLADDTLPLTSDNVYSEIQQDLLRPIFISSLMANDTFVRDWVLDGERDPDRIIRFLGTIQQRYNTVTSYFISDRTRNYYHPKGILKKVSRGEAADAWYFRARSINEDYEINVDADTAAPNNMTVFINHRIMGYDGQLIGIIGVGLAVESVRKLVDAYERRYGRTILFTDREGQVTLHGEGYTGPANIRDHKGLGKIATQILTSPGGSFTYEEDQVTHYVNSRFVPEFKWLLLVEQRETEASAELLQTLIANILLAGLITVVVILLAYLTVGSYQRRLEEMATTDKLTGTLSRQAFDGVLQQALKVAERRETPLSLCVIDLDHFKLVNDTHGHLAGDRVLQEVSTVIRDTIRESDVLCRWGGEEFLLLLNDCPEEKARDLAEKIRLAIEKRRIDLGNMTISVTTSIGLAERRSGEAEKELVSRADQALYEAKDKGRNQTRLAA